MSKKNDPCWSCRGEGTDSWCNYCGTIAEPDAFGLPHETDREGTWIQTWSGNKLWPLSPEPEHIMMMDIAVGESRENRYSKQTVRSYKVAEHSVIVSRLVGRFARAARLPDHVTHGLEREGLMHDCDEGILPDMARPLKHEPVMTMGPFRLAGKRIQQAVYAKMSIVSTDYTHGIIDAIDKRLVLDEVTQVMRRPELYLDRHGHLKSCGVTLECLSEDDSLIAFVERFEQLFPEYEELDLGAGSFLP